ncbi:MAG TPA: hypothetical protein VFM01_04665 [Nakamurella sp.]|nr:hypothetical protein [Nakamurella sp.]
MTIIVNHLQAVDEPAADFRRVILAALAKSSATTARDGVLAGLAVSDGASGMDVVVAPGQAVVSGYLVTNTANATLTPDAGGATTRTDLIALQVLDQEAGDASSLGQVIVVKGTSAAVPATPTRAIPLATINVTAGANTLTGSAITDARGYTGATGPIQAPGRLGVAPFGLVDGSLVYDPQARWLGVQHSATEWSKFMRDTDVTAAIAAKVAAAVLETTRSSATVDVQGAWDQISMTSTGQTIGTGWTTPSGWTQVPAQGWYSITGGATFGANTAGARRGIGFVDANGSMIGTPLLLPAASSGNVILSHTVEAWRPTSSQVRMVLWQDAAASMTVTDMRLTVRLAIVG